MYVYDHQFHLSCSMTESAGPDFVFESVYLAGSPLTCDDKGKVIQKETN
jgi:hypothetical protein